MNRRQFLTAAPAAASLLATGAAAHVDPASRRYTPGAPYKLAIAAYSYRQFLDLKKPTMTLFDFIQKSAELGTDGVELTEYYFQKPLTDEYVLKLKHHAHLWGQTITGTPIGNSFTHPAGPMRDQQVATYKKWVDVSYQLGSPAIRTFAGSAPKGTTEADARRNVIETLEDVCDYAGQRGVFVGMENHGGVVAEADGLLEIVKAVKSPWLGINLDSGNFRTADPVGDLTRCAPYAVTVQYKVNTSPQGGPGQSPDFPNLVRILKDAGYRGFITLEYEGREDPLVAVPRILAEMRKAMLG